MKKLKTLKDLSPDLEVVFKDTLREEAIKWFKSGRLGCDFCDCKAVEVDWCDFFNITEDDLKC